MAYNANIPQAGDQLSQSQPQILNNFIAIKALIDVDHVDFASSNMGFHNRVTLVTQGSNPGFAVGTPGLYSFTNPTSGVSEIYISKSNPQIQVPLSAGNLGNPGGYSYLGSGLLIKWGKSSNFTTPTLTVNTNASTPVWTNGISQVYITTVDTAGSFNNVLGLTAAPTGTTFTVGSFNGNTPPSTVSFTWLAIGY